LKKNGDLSYQYAGLETTDKEIQIDSPDKEKIFYILTQIEKQHACDLRQAKILVRADGDIQFKDFEVLIEALKQKDLRRYNLIAE
jgi:hypothetical protein